MDRFEKYGNCRYIYRWLKKKPVETPSSKDNDENLEEKSEKLEHEEKSEKLEEKTEEIVLKTPDDIFGPLAERKTRKRDTDDCK